VGGGSGPRARPRAPHRRDRLRRPPRPHRPRRRLGAGKRRHRHPDLLRQRQEILRRLRRGLAGRSAGRMTAMVRPGWVAAVLVATVASGLALLPAPASAASGSIAGTVVAAEGNLPVEAVEVCAWEVGAAEPNRCAATQSDGTYAIET